MRALADAAADDPDVEEAYNGIVEGFVDATARHIEEEIAVGADPAASTRDETAKALVWMMERYLNLSFGHDSRRRRARRSPRR